MGSPIQMGKLYSMKVLLAYDGSEYGDAALADVERACLNDAGILVLSVSETWMPGRERHPTLNDEHRAALHEHAERAVAHAKIMAQGAAAWLRERHPHWHISSIGAAGSPLDEILKQAESCNADLIITGAHGPKGVLRLLPGSVSLGVVTHAPCSARIARQVDATRATQPPRILVAVDGSADSTAVLDWIRSRCWPAGTQAEVISVVETQLLPLAIPGLSIGPTSEEWARCVVSLAAEQLQEIGLCVFTTVERGDPKAILLDAARKSSASCIYIGAKGLTRSRHPGLGGVSTAVAMRAHCTVDVVRVRDSKPNPAKG
jgi:nucleotide-binding universal stress UspA family protein